MTEAGAPPEAIAIAIEAIEDAVSDLKSKEELRLKKQRDRKRVQRQSRDCPGTGKGQSTPPLSSPVVPPAPPSYNPNSPLSPPIIPPAPQLEEAKELYNEAARQSGWGVCQAFNDRRKKALRQRLVDCGGLDGWKHALAKARGSPGLSGNNDRGWKLDFDAMVQQKTFTRIMEGYYDDWGKTPRNKNSFDAFTAALRQELAGE